MAQLIVSSGAWDQTTAEYVEEVDESADPAYVRVRLDETSAGDVDLFLRIEDVRYLADALPYLLMTHDAAERADAERMAARKSAAKPKAA